MLRFRPLLALVLLVVLTGGTAVHEVHRAVHAVEAAEERAEHAAEHHAGHDHDTPAADAPCTPELESDCAVCAVSPSAALSAQNAVPPATADASRLQAEARATWLAAASSGARGPPQV